MKNKFLQKISLLALTLTFVFLLSACGRNMDTNPGGNTSGNGSTNQPENDITSSQNNTSDQNDNYASSNQQNSSNGQNSSDNNSSILTETTKISKDEAKKIAFNDANVKENEIRDLDVELDHYNGKASYEISFEKDNIDYDYEIDATTGKILERKKDKED
jgi:uncharacterized membrane protein YkoI